MQDPISPRTTSHCRAFVVLSVSRFRTIVLHLDTLVAPYAHSVLHASMRPDGRTVLDLYHKFRIAEGVDQGFYAMAFLTEWAVVAVVG